MVQEMLQGGIMETEIGDSLKIAGAKGVQHQLPIRWEQWRIERKSELMKV